MAEKEAYSGSVRPEASTIFCVLIEKKIQNYEYNIRYKSEYIYIYLGPLPGPWKRSLQGRGPDV